MLGSELLVGKKLSQYKKRLSFQIQRFLFIGVVEMIKTKLIVMISNMLNSKIAINSNGKGRFVSSSLSISIDAPSLLYLFYCYSKKALHYDYFFIQKRRVLTENLLFIRINMTKNDV